MLIEPDWYWLMLKWISTRFFLSERTFWSFLVSADIQSSLCLPRWTVCCSDVAWYEVMLQSFYIVPITVASLTVIEQYFTFHIARIAHKGNYIKCHTSCTEGIKYPGKAVWSTRAFLKGAKCYSKPVKKTWGAIMYWYWFCERLGERHPGRYLLLNMK